MKSKDNPWYSMYDESVPHHINYPQVALPHLWDVTVKRFPSNYCCIFKDVAFTYEKMDALVSRFAANLLAGGLMRGERIAILLPNCPEFIIAFYAILKAGGVVVAINPAYKERELLFQLDNSGSVFVITESVSYELIKSLQPLTQLRKIVIVNSPGEIAGENVSQGALNWMNNNDESFLNYCKKDVPPIEFEIDPVSPAIFQYSGGTTGVPKAAIGTHNNLVANTLQFRAWLGELTEGDERVMVALPLFHVYGMVIAMSLGIAIGAVLVLEPDPRDIKMILESLDRYRVTLFPGVPSLYQSIVQDLDVINGKYNLASIKACISGSAPLSAEVKVEFERITGGRLLEGYGLSEAPTATHCNPRFGENKSGSIGLPLPDVEAIIVDMDDNKKILPVGKQGELIIRGPQVMKGYHLNPEDTASSLRDGWLFTGDIAVMDQDGYFYLVGRKKELIKVGGFQVWPREVEEVISTNPDVLECAVAGVEGADRDEKVIAWVVIRKGALIQPIDIKLWCEKKLVRYKSPTEVIFLEKLPRTSVGKILRRVLIQLRQG